MSRGERSADDLLADLRHWTGEQVALRNPSAFAGLITAAFRELDELVTGGELPGDWRPDPLSGAFYCPDCGAELDDWRGHEESCTLRGPDDPVRA